MDPHAERDDREQIGRMIDGEPPRPEAGARRVPYRRQPTPSLARVVGRNWAGLVEMIPRLRREVAAAPAALPLPERAAWVAYASFIGTIAPEQVATVAQRIIDGTKRLGPHERREVTHDFQSRLGLAALALTSRCKPPTWLVRPSASALIAGTDLHAIPSEPPPLLRGPGIVETRRPETGERLWGDVASLGWFPADDVVILLGVRYPTGYFVARWAPQWTGEDLEDQLPECETSPLIDDVDDYEAFAQTAARYLIVLGLLAEIEDGPLRIELDRREQREGRQRRAVYLRDPAPRPPAEQAPAIDLTGRVVGASAAGEPGSTSRRDTDPPRRVIRPAAAAGY